MHFSSAKFQPISISPPPHLSFVYFEYEASSQSLRMGVKVKTHVNHCVRSYNYLVLEN